MLDTQRRVAAETHDFQCDIHDDYFLNNIHLALNDEPSEGYYWFGNNIE